MAGPKKKSGTHDAGKLFMAAIVVVAIAAVGLFYWEKSKALEGTGPRERPGANCAEHLDRAVLERSLELGTGFLLGNQRPEGNFNYEIDWQTLELTHDDNQVRQAGAAWGLGLLYQDARERGDQARAERVRPALLKALAFFETTSRTTERGERYVVYPQDPSGSLGSVALVALAEIELLRGERAHPEPRPGGGAREAELAGLDEQAQAFHRRRLDEYLAFLLHARTPEGRFRNDYDIATGESRGPSSPYSEGEALLALVKAARYLDRVDLLEAIRSSAEACYAANVTAARRSEADSDTTKGFFQWSSMTFFELATSDWDDVEQYGDWLLELSDWMLDTHNVLERQRNTGYAFEGIVHAYAYAARRGDQAHATKLGCAIERGLEKLTSWQVGSPIANDFLREARVTDPRALGGVQNHRSEPKLRIDVAQHQMHAVMLTLRYYFVGARSGSSARGDQR